MFSVSKETLCLHFSPFFSLCGPQEHIATKDSFFILPHGEIQNLEISDASPSINHSFLRGQNEGGRKKENTLSQEEEAFQYDLGEKTYKEWGNNSPKRPRPVSTEQTYLPIIGEQSKKEIKNQKLQKIFTYRNTIKRFLPFQHRGIQACYLVRTYSNFVLAFFQGE